jgi:hypothetical protein
MRTARHLQKCELVALRRFFDATGTDETESAIPGNRTAQVAHADAGVKKYWHDDEAIR